MEENANPCLETQNSHSTIISTVSLAVVGMTKLSAGSELTLTRQASVVESATLSSGLMERVEEKKDWLPNWVVPEMVLILGDDDGVLQVKFTITLISSTLVRLIVQMMSRAVPATMGTAGLTGWTTTAGGETGGRESE